MSACTVTSQAQLDAALADPAITEIAVRSERGVWLHVNATRGKIVTAWGEASVTAWDKASVTAGGEASVTAWDKASVTAGGKASVTAGGKASVRAGDKASVTAGGKASVTAWDEASVTAWGEASVTAWDKASVTAWDKASVTAWDKASVTAWGEASVRAGGEASVTAWGEASVTAGTHVAVHLYSGTCKVDGGVLVDHAAVDQSDPAAWCAYHCVEVDDGHAVLYKAVRVDWRSTHGTSYEPGTTATCADYRSDGWCGGGLHLSPTPSQAAAYDGEATRYVQVRVALAGINVIDASKVKAASVECVCEVDVHGRPIVAEVGASA